MTTTTTTPKKATYGDGLAIMILAGERMGLEPTLIDIARAQLKGDAVHPMNAAALEREAGRMNDKVRSSAARVAEANAHASTIKIEFGFAAPTAERESSQ